MGWAKSCGTPRPDLPEVDLPTNNVWFRKGLNTGTATHTWTHQKMRIRFYRFQSEVEKNDCCCWVVGWVGQPAEGWKDPPLDYWTNRFSSPIRYNFTRKYLSFAPFPGKRARVILKLVRKLQSKLKMVEKQWEIILEKESSWHVSMGWLKGKSTGNHRFSHDFYGIFL